MSPRLRFIFGLSIPFFILHGTEEYLYRFYDVYPLFQAASHTFQNTAQGVFLTFQLMWWLMLIIALLVSIGKKGQIVLMTVLGFIYFYELNHLFHAILQGNYYPGLITSLPLPIIGFFFWKELIRNFRMPTS